MDMEVYLVRIWVKNSHVTVGILLIPRELLMNSETESHTLTTIISLLKHHFPYMTHFLFGSKRSLDFA